jgi:hypothetical protein
MEPLAQPLNARCVEVWELMTFILLYVRLLANRWAVLDEGDCVSDQLLARRSVHPHGIADDFFLWMLYQAHVELYLPCSGRGQAANEYRPSQSVRLTDDVAFFLTEAGEIFAGEFLGHVFDPEDQQPCDVAWAWIQLGAWMPRYDWDNRVFTWGRQVIKQFRQPAERQEVVLLTAEELGWPLWFDDPLPRVRGRNPKKRLHDTIQDLNRRQQRAIVQFKGDGTGTRVGWELF